ncbi:hypothetical protein DNX55_23320 [Escherichia coli]|jgi:DSF synthase|uniref:Enoyl-CoA hydratase n=4 Tax=Escherichia coli TaxID=562 RepID=A0AB74M9I7_ECOLX|nr:crotonase/enoyl-CoA hydratase family protein [Escherichia coli]EER1407063.1 hypothetical protein [Escherichia coli]EFE8185696.1 hypothetical protein [Escherichia coli]EFE9471451.1 hypothetical protein [Escherichia coli]EFG3592464.1 hypothetical protein [Escherichia coli]EFK2539651.1 hypothetical protein [Escherichia coli]
MAFASHNPQRYDIGEDCFALYHSESHSFEVFLGSERVPFFSAEVVDKMLGGMTKIAHGELDCSSALHFFVLRSAFPGIFNLGADLDLFHSLAAEKNRDELRLYADKCVDLIHHLSHGINNAITTVALVEGKCFGGGFEAVLACDYLIASESALFSFPEIKLGIFPGMGAASVMSRVLNKGDYQRIFLSGEMFSAQQLFDMGLVSQLVPDGQGEAVLRQFLKRMNSAACYQLSAIYKYNKRLPVSELRFFAEQWVEGVMDLTRRQLALIAYAATQQRE